MIDWLKRCAHDQNSLGLNSTRAILLRLWKRHFLALSPAWWSWQAVLNFSDISKKIKNQNNKFQPHNNILASPEPSPGNCLLYI